MHRDRKHYSENLQRQIRENELARIKERKAFFEEGVKLDDEAKARRAKLDDIKKKKLNELRFVHILRLISGSFLQFCLETRRF